MAANYGTYTSNGQAVAMSQGGGSSGGTYSQVFNIATGGFTGRAAVYSVANQFNLTNSSGTVNGSGYACPAYTTSGHSAGALCYVTPQTISSGFTSQFTFQLQAITGSATAPSIGGMAFVIQNYTANPCQYFYLNGSQIYGDPRTYYADANMCGYGGYYPPPGGLPALLNSIGVKIDMGAVNALTMAYNPALGVIAHTGLYGNGGPLDAFVPTTDMAATGLNLYAPAGRVFQCNIVYDSTLKLLTTVIMDTVTGAQHRKTYPVDVAAVMGGNSGYVSLNVGIGPGVYTQFYVMSWSFGTGLNARLATPTISPAAGNYSSAQTVTISGPSGSTLYYTTNGLEPTSSSNLYTGSFSVSSNTIIKAIAIQSGHTDSLVACNQINVGASANLINLPSGFTGSAMVCNGSASITGGALQLCPTGGNYPGYAGSGFWPAPVNITAFTWKFGIQVPAGNSGGTGDGVGFTACIQNANAMTTNANYQWASGGIDSLSASKQGFGYAGNLGGYNIGLLNSIAVVFDIANNVTGLYFNGSGTTGSAVSFTGGMSLQTTHLINCTLTYTGASSLTLAMTDTVNSDTFSHTWTGVNIPSYVGANTALVGFTGGTDYYTSNQLITNMTFSSP